MDTALIIEEIKKINTTLNEYNWSIKFIDYTDDKIVKILLQGYCIDCPFSQVAAAASIEDYLKNKFGDTIKAIEMINK